MNSFDYRMSCPPMLKNKMTFRCVRDQPPHSESIRLRRSVDGDELYVEMSGRAIQRNPVYRLCSRTYRGQRHRAVRFFSGRHWLLPVLAGSVVGALSWHLAWPDEPYLFIMPVWMIYYQLFAFSLPTAALELKRRGVMSDLYMIPFFNPLLLPAGVVFASRFAHLRIASASVTACGMSLLIHGGRPDAPRIQILVAGAMCALFGFGLAWRALAPRGDKRFAVTLSEINGAMIWLEGRWGGLAWLSIRVWLGCLVMAGVCALLIVWFQTDALWPVLALCLLQPILVKGKFRVDHLINIDKVTREYQDRIRNIC